MYCSSCGIELHEGALFCVKCGMPQETEQASSAPVLDEAAALRLKRGLFFLDNWLAFTALLVLTTVTTVLFIVGSNMPDAGDPGSFMQNFCLVGALAMAALASSRTGGLDLSVGGVMALSAMILAMNASSNSVFGFLLSIAVCVAIGLLNGLFIMVLRMPAIFVTVASAMLTRGISMWASEGISVNLPSAWANMGDTSALLAFIAAIGIAILLLWLTGGLRKQKKPCRGNMKLFWIYIPIAMIGMLAGWAAALCYGTASSTIGSGSSNEMVLLFIFATISASALLKDNRVALGFTVVLALLWTVHDQAMYLLNLSPFSMMVSNASWVFILLAIMAISKRSWQKPAWDLLFP